MGAFLAKVGSLILKGVTEGAQIISGAGPLEGLLSKILPTNVGTVIGDFETFSQIILQVEVIGQTLGLTGAQKLQAATPLIAQALLKVESMRGMTFKNQPAFQQAVTNFTSALADILNAAGDEPIVTTSAAKS